MIYYPEYPIKPGWYRAIDQIALVLKDGKDLRIVPKGVRFKVRTTETRYPLTKAILAFEGHRSFERHS